MIVRCGLNGEEATGERDLRAAFSMLDANGSGNLSLGEWLQGSGEEELDYAGSVGQGSSKDELPKKKATPLAERPGWKTKKIATTAHGQTLLEAQKEDDSLPPRLQKRVVTPKAKRDAHQGVWKRTEEILERRQKTKCNHEQKGEEQLAKEMTLKPKLSTKSKQIMRGKHVKPWEGRQWEHERIFERRLKEDQEVLHAQQ